jgi:hypothetical protein
VCKESGARDEITFNHLSLVATITLVRAKIEIALSHHEQGHSQGF